MWCFSWCEMTWKWVLRLHTHLSVILRYLKSSIHRQNEGDSDKWSNNEFADDNKKNKCVNEPELMTHWVLGRSTQHDQVLCHVLTAVMMCSVIESWWNLRFMLLFYISFLDNFAAVAQSLTPVMSSDIWFIPFRFGFALSCCCARHIFYTTYIRFVLSQQAFFFFSFFSIYQRVISTQFQSHGLELECISYELRLSVYFC